MPGIFKTNKRHTHYQTTASSVWTISHNMGGYAVVDVYIDIDGSVQRIIPFETNYVDGNTMSLVFSVPRTGTAALVV